MRRSRLPPDAEPSHPGGALGPAAVPCLGPRSPGSIPPIAAGPLATGGRHGTGRVRRRGPGRRALPPRAGARHRRDGVGLAGARRDPAASHGRDQGAACGAAARGHRAREVPARNEALGRVGTPPHRPAPRRWISRGHPVPRHGVHAGRQPARPPGAARGADDGSIESAADHRPQRLAPAGLGGPRLRACPRRGPPRREAREHPLRRGGDAARRGLRAGEGAAGGVHAHAERRSRRHGDVRPTRGDDVRPRDGRPVPRRRALRPVRARDDGVRTAGGVPAVPRGFAGGRPLSQGEAGRAVARACAARVPARPRPRSGPSPVPGPQGPVAVVQGVRNGRTRRPDLDTE